jgi:hypothetical protein
MLVESPSARFPVYVVVSLAGWGIGAASTSLLYDVAIAYDRRTSYGS